MKNGETFRFRRFVIVWVLVLLLISMVGFTGYLAITVHENFSEWVGFCVVLMPIIMTAIGAWLGFESSKLKGGRFD